MAITNRYLKIAAISGTLCLIFASFWACAPKRIGNDINDLTIPGYLQLQEDMSNLDTTALQGRRIVLDPGHGGKFRGAIGPGNQHEADANLGVSLYLRGLLEWAGAKVYMTRTSDHDFLTPADSTLAHDLAFRVSFTDSLQPDVFISIHHNATASADPTINETQTYYPISDAGASLDLARSIHRHLVMNLNITPAKIMPGNFHVLRKATVPAVLGEPAMISNPVMAGRLSQAGSLKLEAEAYFLGILDYFASGVPIYTPGIPLTEGYTVLGDTIFCPEESDLLTIQWQFETRPGEPGPATTSFQLLANGENTPFSISPDGMTITWCGNPPTSSPLVLKVRGQNTAGRATPLRTTTLLPAEPNNSRHVLIPENPANAGPRLALLHSIEKGDESWSLVQAVGEQMEAPLSPGLQWHLFQNIPTNSANFPSWKARLPWSDLSHCQIIHNQHVPAIALPMVGAEASPVWIEIPGYLPLVDPNPSRTDIARTITVTGRHWPLQPLVPQLQHKVIVIDAAGGGVSSEGQGPLGTRGSDLNLDTALHLKKLLLGAGAQVVLTRSEEGFPKAENKVKLANESGADFFLTITRTPNSSQAMVIQHHPQSSRGIAWAKSTGKYLTPLLIKNEDLKIAPNWAYLLRHTACPALIINLPLPLTTAQENKQRHPTWTQAEARALFLGIIEQVIPTTTPLHSFDPATIIPLFPNTAFKLNDIQRVLVDGNFPWFPPNPLLFNHSPVLSQSLVLWNGPGLPDISPIHTLELHTSSGWQIWAWESKTSPGSAKLLLGNE